ncbi:SapC family protein [Massilia sp. TSP1-1-2]|uniref:SapC family protein n=1 Tax=unclassified Massilia TaxID=2609279 RepID=UPI003CEE69F7
MATMIFYQKPTALNRERHRNLKLDASAGNFSFAEKTNSVLIAATEIVDAALSYPVVFVGKAGGPFTLAAMVGLNDQENLYVDANGQWEADCYLPAFVRRYPFVLAEGDGEGADLTVCVDESFVGLNEETGEALFDADGTEAPLLTGAVDFLRLFHIEMQNTNAFAARLAELDLLTQKTIEVQRDGKKQLVEGIFIIDQEKLMKLDDVTLLHLLRNGDMSLIHAHLFSLKHVPRLAARLDRRTSAATQAATEAAQSLLESMPAAPTVM